MHPLLQTGGRLWRHGTLMQRKVALRVPSADIIQHMSQLARRTRRLRTIHIPELRPRICKSIENVSSSEQIRLTSTAWTIISPPLVVIIERKCCHHVFIVVPKAS